MTTDNRLERLNVHLIPRPQRITMQEGLCRLNSPIGVALCGGAGDNGKLAAEHLVQSLQREWNLSVEISEAGAQALAITFARTPEISAQGYRLGIAPGSVGVEFSDGAGAYYAVQTLRQALSRQGDDVVLPCMAVEDAPALKYRAAHYDTKHHQPTAAYVESLIEELAHYKINVLVWEWEDKLAYHKHPEIGAPGAFSVEQMQAFTRYARRHHVQIVPLVQGLGHVSFILKHPRFRHLREIPDSNWQFCPLKEGSYELLFDLWAEAIEATPGSEFLHIGSDETYELGEGEACGCKVRAKEIGADGLMQTFIRRCVEYGEKQGRTVLTWGGEWKAGSAHLPPRSMIFVDSTSTDYLLAAKQAGYPGWVYAPNPGITPLFLPYFPTVIHSVWRDWPGRVQSDFAQTARLIGQAARANAVDGSITTTWDDSGLHMQCWMPHLICGEFSWNPAERDIEQWASGFMANYFGPQSRNLRELFVVLQEAAEFYDDTFERRVWHFGDIGKIHLPDFPRGDLEFSDYWRRQYSRLLPTARRQCQDLDLALWIIDDNLARSARHSYDLQVMRTCARLMRHSAALVLMLADMENELVEAQNHHYMDRSVTIGHLKKIQTMIEGHLRERQEVFVELVGVWEQTRLPKGLSLPGRPFVFARDRARHFANRTPDMTYLILDENKLDLEGYLARLRTYIAEYK